MSEGEASILTTELLDEIHRLPENINRTEKLLKTERKKYETLIQLRPVIDKVQRLEKHIPTRKDVLKLLENKLLENKLAEVKITVSAELENEQSILEKNQTDYDRGRDSLHKLREERNKLKDATIKLQQGVQSLPQLKERQVELNKQIDANAKEITMLQQQFQPLKQQLTTSIEEKQRLKESNRKIVLQMQAKLDSLRTLDHDIQRAHVRLQSSHYRLTLSHRVVVLVAVVPSNDKPKPRSPQPV